MPGITKAYKPRCTGNSKLMCSMRDKVLCRWHRASNPLHRRYYQQISNYTNQAFARDRCC